MEERDLFRLFVMLAPTPSDEQIKTQHDMDRMSNPHGDYHKPQRREREEIILDYKIKFVEIMRKKTTDKPSY
jgi:hypothetical protein